MICCISFIFACSGPDDHIFVFYTDHGAPGLIGFPGGMMVSTINTQILSWFSHVIYFLLTNENIHVQEHNFSTVCRGFKLHSNGLSAILVHVYSHLWYIHDKSEHPNNLNKDGGTHFKENQHGHMYIPSMAYAGHMIQETQQEKSKNIQLTVYCLEITARLWDNFA